MASIIIEKTNNSKGILIFKNNELPFINNKYLNKLSESYFLGLYFGSFQEKKIEINKNFQFTISAEGLLNGFYNIPNINIQGWNFSSSIKSKYELININPIYDIQAIAYNGLRKQLRHMILFFKAYLEMFPEKKARILAVNSCNNPLNDHSIGKFYESKVPTHLRERLILHKVDCYSSKKLSSNEIRISLMEAKINVIGSRDEGAPRMMAESLTLKRPILLSDATKMASTQHINKRAFLKFISSKDFIHKAEILKFISMNYDPEELYPEFFIENSIATFASELEKICKLKRDFIIDYFYKKNLDKVYSHYLTGHSKIIDFNPISDDDVCANKLDFLLLCQKILNEKIPKKIFKPKNFSSMQILKKIRLKLYYFKVKIFYRFNCPNKSTEKELNKHFRKTKNLI